jgi:glycosyltransferase involved in cell wall biosynthesis
MGRLPVELARRIEYFPHNVACASAVAERMISGGAPIRLLSVCRLIPKKGIDMVLRALTFLPSSLHYCYRVVGDGPELPRLRALADALGLGGVQFAGALPPESVEAEMAAAHVFVLGARTAPDGDRDGIPNAVLEAMAAGLPVVVSDGGAVSEVIRHRHTGWLTPPDNPRAFAEALREVATQPELRKAVTANARAQMWCRFSSNRTSALFAGRLATEIRST